MQPLSPGDRRILIEAVRSTGWKYSVGHSSYSPFAGCLEQAITTVKNYPKLPFTPENVALRDLQYEDREAAHRRIISWLIEYFELKDRLIARAHERWLLYKRTQPDAKLEDRWATAGEWLINKFMNELSPNQLAAIVEARMPA